MTKSTDPGPLELSALLCSRVCHDLISPVGAIVNGLEVLEEDDDEEMRGHAMELIKKSAAQASAKLQFARLAFGAAGSAGAELDLADAKAMMEGMIDGDRVKLDWTAPVATVDKDVVKLLLNMMLIATASIPRGGRLTVTVTIAEQPSLRILAQGPSARIPDEAARYLADGGSRDGPLDARSIQPLYTDMVARGVGLKVRVAMDGDDFVIATG